MLLLCLLQFLRILVTLFLKHVLSAGLPSLSLGQLVKSGQIVFLGSVEKVSWAAWRIK